MPPARGLVVAGQLSQDTGEVALSSNPSAANNIEKGRVPLGTQVVWLFVLAIPVACVAWTATHEEVFREAREYCITRSQRYRHWYQRKFFYVFTCEYCFSHYVVVFFLALTRYKLLYQDWRGYLIAGFALVFVANLYISLYGNLRLDIKKEHTEIKAIEAEVQEKEKPRLEKPAA